MTGSAESAGQNVLEELFGIVDDSDSPAEARGEKCANGAGGTVSRGEAQKDTEKETPVQHPLTERPSKLEVQEIQAGDHHAEKQRIVPGVVPCPEIPETLTEKDSRIDNTNTGEVSKEQTSCPSSSAKLQSITLEYDFQELESATQQFSESNRLGSGSAGTVYRACMPDGSVVAVKLLDLTPVGNSLAAGFEEEIMTLSKFRHPNLVMLMGWSREATGRRCCLVYEYMSGGDMSQKLQRCKEGKTCFSWHERLLAALDAATGLAHLHTMRPCAFHRDVKSANILLGHGVAKLADFGLSCAAKDRQTKQISCSLASGTAGYACPDYIKSGIIHEKSEVYSLGVVLLEVLVNLPPAAFRDGELIYPLMDGIGIGKPGALERCLDILDCSAAWPVEVSIGLARLALECVADVRPGFVQVCRSLRQLLPESGAGLSPDSAEQQERVEVESSQLPPPFSLVVGQPPEGELLATVSLAKLRVGRGLQSASFWEALVGEMLEGVKQEHFEVALESSGLVLRDLAGSGMLLNGEWVHGETQVQHNDLIAIPKGEVEEDGGLALVTFRLVALGLKEEEVCSERSQPLDLVEAEVNLPVRAQCPGSVVCTLS